MHFILFNRAKELRGERKYEDVGDNQIAGYRWLGEEYRE